MRRIAKLSIAVALPLAALTTAARAQLAGIPVYYNPQGGTGVGVAAHVGFPNTDAGGGTAFGVAGSFGTGPVTLSAMVGAWKATSSAAGFSWPSAQTSFGGAVAYRLFGGGFLPIAVAAQAGYGVIKYPTVTTPLGTTPSFTQTTIPVGVGISFDPPMFPLKPWIAPRMDFKSGGGSSKSNFAVSAGVNFNLLLGLGIHAAADWSQNKVGGKTYNPLILSLGAHFNFHVAMM
jgi:hypothetical protein